MSVVAKAAGAEIAVEQPVVVRAVGVRTVAISQVTELVQGQSLKKAAIKRVAQLVVAVSAEQRALVVQHQVPAVVLAHE